MKKVYMFLLLTCTTQTAFADITCGVSLSYVAQYEINSYTCPPGQFLPANSLGCVACPSGLTCPGGTFDFDANNFQGLSLGPFTGAINNTCAANFPVNQIAIYEPTTYTCNPGYYLPSNTDHCVMCPANSYCVGGTYTFNETTAQGITACAAGLYAPTGMWESAQCGRILHIGDEVLYLRATKITPHALHVDVDHDGVADYFGNMTTADVVMHAGSERKLKIKLGDTVYSVYDDTITVPTE